MLRQKPTPNTLAIVLFLTDGLQAFRQTFEVALRLLAAKSNMHDRRVYTIGVDADVNPGLLTTYIIPQRVLWGPPNGAPT
jgi:hypothetical protein